MEVLGDAQMRTATDTYSHVMPALGRDAADRMAARCGTDTAPWHQWPPRWHQKRLRPLSTSENGRVRRVELRGLEPLTPHCQAVMIPFGAVRRGSATALHWHRYWGQRWRTTANVAKLQPQLQPAQPLGRVVSGSP